MRFISVAAVGVLIAATPDVSAAQVASPAGEARAPQSGDAMQGLIKALSGRWSLKLKFEPSRESPAGLEGTGEETWHAGPEGLTLTDEEVFHAGPNSVVVVGIFWRDMKTNDLHAMDCYKGNPHTCDLEGAADVVVHWTGSELTVDEKERSPQGTMMTSRIEWSDITATSFTESGYLAAPGGPFHKTMTVHATREATGQGG
jgi:hypothetical protein